jgi:MFS family permease
MNSSSASEDGTNPSDPVYEKRWKILAAISMGVFLATIDASIVNVALPTLEKAFTTRFAVIQWIPLAYMLTVATLILSMGRLGDLKGKKKIYLSVCHSLYICSSPSGSCRRWALR